MKTLITASALALITQVAFADSIYGNFASAELDTSFSSGPALADPPAQPSGVEVSLYVLYQNDPDAANNLQGYVLRESPAGEELTAYDHLMLGNPDSGPGPHAPAVVAPGDRLHQPPSGRQDMR
jgi:hypothetical protein